MIFLRSRSKPGSIEGTGGQSRLRQTAGRMQSRKRSECELLEAASAPPRQDPLCVIDARTYETGAATLLSVRGKARMKEKHRSRLNTTRNENENENEKSVRLQFPPPPRSSRRLKGAKTLLTLHSGLPILRPSVVGSLTWEHCPTERSRVTCFSQKGAAGSLGKG